jgi:hypothetical protein
MVAGVDAVGVSGVGSGWPLVKLLLGPEVLGGGLHHVHLIPRHGLGETRRDFVVIASTFPPPISSTLRAETLCSASRDRLFRPIHLSHREDERHATTPHPAAA